MRRTHIPALLIAACLPFLTARQASAAVFVDIDNEHPYADAISWLEEKGYVKGFDDGSFRADRTITRAEALKIIVSAEVSSEDIQSCDVKSIPYQDVSTNDWYAPHACAGLENDILVPENDQLFRPGDTINVAEISAILARAEKMQVAEDDSLWFAPSIRALGGIQAIPAEIKSYGERVTRGQLAEMLWRSKNAITDRDAADAEAIISAQCDWFEHEDIAGVDEQEVTRAWLTWVNEERRNSGLVAYRPDKHLARTAMLWSGAARDIGAITHKRIGQTAYYDYGIMTDWFADNGIEFANAGGSTFTENIGWGMYRCTEGMDCTDSFITSVRSTFDFFMSEKGKAYRPHYNSIVNNHFRLAGLGIAVDPNAHRYYLTVHYGTDVASTPDPICP